jgi:carbonic anhydrase/acetyltransferase-like protein (isoleucine patch superfamily)
LLHSVAATRAFEARGLLPGQAPSGIAGRMKPDARFAGVLCMPSAAVFGDVEIGRGSSLWMHAVIRAECQRVRIGRCSNLQDFSMVHVGYDHPTVIGDFCSITHHATVHGATVGDACLVGIGAVLMDGVVLGAGSIVAGGAVLREGSVFEPGSIVAGVPGKVIRQRDCARENRMNAWLYHRNAGAYARGDHRAWDGAEFERWKDELAKELGTDADLLRLDGL